MTQLLFRNRWLALMWAVVSLISVAAYVGEGGGHEQVDRAAAQLKAQQTGMQAEAVDEGDGFSAEEDLIDKTGDEEGEDTAGMQPPPGTQIVERSVVVEQPQPAPQP